jgi:hypothetical protein
MPTHVEVFSIVIDPKFRVQEFRKLILQQDPDPKEYTGSKGFMKSAMQ